MDAVCVDKKGVINTSTETVRYIITYEEEMTNRLTLKRINRITVFITRAYNTCYNIIAINH